MRPQEDLAPGNCTPCPNHSWASEHASTSPTACLCMSDATGPPGGPCECQPGYYSPSSGSGYVYACGVCPNGSTSLQGSVSISACECAPGFNGSTADAGGCTACPPNMYKSTMGNDEQCLACPASTTSLAGSRNLTECLCRPGFSGTNGDNCTACAADFFKDFSGEGACMACPLDTSTGGAQGAANQTECLCVTPRSQGDPGGPCICTAGHGFGEGGAAGCGECTIGSYKAGSGNVACTACPPRSSTEGNASTDASNCTCVPGSFGPGPGQACTLCALGSYQNLTGASECMACQDGFTTESRGTVDPSQCVCSPGNTGPSCLPCPAGTFSPGGANAPACQDCPPGSESGNGSAACVCKEGAQGPPEACTCSAGWYGNASSACQLCPGNSTSPAESANITDCVCMAGYSGPDGGPCLGCPADTYKDVLGDGNCSVCPAGTFSSPLSGQLRLCRYRMLQFLDSII
jgi:hypothetical protein